MVQSQMMCARVFKVRVDVTAQRNPQVSVNIFFMYFNFYSVKYSVL